MSILSLAPNTIVLNLKLSPNWWVKLLWSSIEFALQSHYTTYHAFQIQSISGILYRLTSAQYEVSQIWLLVDVDSLKFMFFVCCDKIIV